MWGWVYGISSGEFIKIGVAGDIKARLDQMKLHNPHPLKVVLRQFVADPYWFEKRMHLKLDRYSVGREWFACDVATIKAAAKAVASEMKDRDREQAVWEANSAQRVEQRSGEGTGKLGRPPKYP